MSVAENLEDVDEFQPGDVLTWTRREAGYLTNRQVKFVDYLNRDEAVIHWGTSQFTVGLDELSIPAPTPRAWWIPPPIQVEVPEPPRDPEEVAAEINTKIAERRDTLRRAYKAAEQAQQAVRAAEELAQRAARQCQAARAELAQAHASAQHDAAAFEQALRRGETAPAFTNGVDREALRHRAEVAEAAQARFDSELAEARRRHSEAKASIDTGAAQVVAAIRERREHELHQLEAACEQLRRTLNGPPEHELPIGPVERQAARETAKKPWRELQQRLADGDADADYLE